MNSKMQQMITVLLTNIDMYTKIGYNCTEEIVNETFNETMEPNNRVAGRNR